jgi:hypothetical protein
MAAESSRAAALAADLPGRAGGLDHLELAATVEDATEVLQRFVERIDAAPKT